MCGIVYKQSFTGEPVNQAITQLYKNQRHRGTDGFGFYMPEEDRLTHNTRENRILELLGKPNYQTTEILFHHRFPTSTENRQNACHPFSTRHNAGLFSRDYVLVHNGHVSNAQELKRGHKELGIAYVSEEGGKFNDSEALLYDVALYLDGQQTELKAEGSIAFIVKDSDGNTFFARNSGSPLKYELTSRGLSIKSEGAGEMVETNTLYQFMADTKNFITKNLTIPSWASSYYGGSYGSSYGSSYGFDYTYKRDVDYHAPKSQRSIWTRADLSDDPLADALDLMWAQGSVKQAIDWVEAKFENNENIIAALGEISETHPSPGNKGALARFKWEQDKFLNVLDHLYELMETEDASHDARPAFLA